MLAKRIIACLDVKNGRTVKGKNFINLIDAGNPLDLAEKYSQVGIDELVLLDISATIEERKTFYNLINEIARYVKIPFTVGGGIKCKEDVYLMLKNGADKVSLNSAIIANANLINELSSEFGSQCIVAAMDVKKQLSDYIVFSRSGSQETKLKALAWAQEVSDRGAGEILLTSIDKDGVKSGFDLEILKLVADQIKIPIIASGGAGKIEDFVDLFKSTKCTGALAASIFHQSIVNIDDLKKQLKNEKIEVRL
jgi:cyclase